VVINYGDAVGKQTYHRGLSHRWVCTDGIEPVAGLRVGDDGGRILSTSGVYVLACASG